MHRVFILSKKCVHPLTSKLHIGGSGALWEAAARQQGSPSVLHQLLYCCCCGGAFQSMVPDDEQRAQRGLGTAMYCSVLVALLCTPTPFASDTRSVSLALFASIICLASSLHFPFQSFIKSVFCPPLHSFGTLKCMSLTLSLYILLLTHSAPCLSQAHLYIALLLHKCYLGYFERQERNRTPGFENNWYNQITEATPHQFV